MDVPVEEKQGYLVELNLQSTNALKELLSRQHAILSKRSFVVKLPDKGEKIRAMVARLEKIITSRRDADSAAEMFARLCLDAEQQHHNRQIHMREDNTTEADMLNKIVNRPQRDTVYLHEDSQKDEPHKPDSNGGSGGEPHRADTSVGKTVPFVDRYSRIVERVEENKQKAEQRKDKYLPHRTIKTEHIDELLTSSANGLNHEKMTVCEEDNESVVTSPIPGSSSGDSEIKPSTQEKQQIHPTTVNSSLQDSSSSRTITSVSNSLMDTTCRDPHLSQAESHSPDSSAIPQSHSPGGSANQMHTSAASTCTSGSSSVQTFHYTSPSPGHLRNNRLKHSYDEALLVTTNAQNNLSAKLIDVGEAAKLIKAQQQKQQVLQAKMAGERLSRTFVEPMHRLDPEGLPITSLQYRDRSEAGADSDSSHSEEESYPD